MKWFQAAYLAVVVILIMLMMMSVHQMANAQPAMSLENQSENYTCSLWNEFSQDQISVIVHSYYRGMDHDMQRTLAAISIVESEAGKYPINVQDPSAGIHHITIRNALTYLEIRDTNYNRNRVASMLIKDPNLSADFALTTLTWWFDYHNGNWDRTWRSYNQGYDWNSHRAGEYAEKIQYWVDRLGDCGWR